ncbi:MAG: phage tail sheath C-terminal domain-containing protein [Planctomycetota bacterium]
MPVRPTYPGVYIEEIPSGVRAIVGVSTSTTAFVGYFARGPENAPVRVNNFGEFERDFGGLDVGSPASYGIQQFFLNGGTEAQVVRVTDGADTASVQVLDEDAAVAFTATAGTQIRGDSLESPGTWGNGLRIEVDYDSSDPATLFNMTITGEEDDGSELTVLRTETFRNLSTDTSSSDYYVDKVNAGSDLVQLTPGSGKRPEPTGTAGNALGSTVPTLNTTDGFDLDFGSGPQTCTLAFDVAPTTWAEVRAVVQAAIRASDSGNPLVEQAVVLLEPVNADATDFRLRVLAGRVLPSYTPRVQFNFSSGITASLGLNVTGNVQKYALGAIAGAVAFQGTATEGTDAPTPSAADLTGVRADKSGMYALEDVEIFNLLCIPEAADKAGTEMRTLYSAAEAYCLERRAMLLIDIHESIASVDAMEAWMLDNATLRHRNAAAYFPRPRIADPLNDYRLTSFAASGTIAGLFARTDGERGVWKAPAGIDAPLRGVQELAYLLTNPECGVLNQIGANCLRVFRDPGIVSWGARTMRGADSLASEWKYVPVRRLALYIEESLYRGTQWAVFEPNDEPLWAQLRLNVGTFMHQLFRQGAFQGSTPDQAYLVQCDDETTTQADIDQGIVNVVVGFAPLKPAEFVIIKIQQLAGQSES